MGAGKCGSEETGRRGENCTCSNSTECGVLKVICKSCSGAKGRSKVIIHSIVDFTIGESATSRTSV